MRTNRQENPWPAQLMQYMCRLRHTAVLPVAPEDVYFGCMPPNIKQWATEGLFGQKAPKEPSVASNFLLTLNVEADARHLRAKKMHISMETAPEYRKAREGKRGDQMVMWVEVARNLPTPINSRATPLFFPRTHPYLAEILDWAHRAGAVQKRIELANKVFREYAKVISSVNGLYGTWPGLIPYLSHVNTDRGLARRVSYKIHEKLAETVKPYMQQIEEDLATCLLLDEAVETHELPGWVNFT